MRSVELFSGCGGLAMGISQAGFHHDLMIEWNDGACATINHNKDRKVQHVSSWPIIKDDVRSMDWSTHGRGIHLVAGGPPCQPFSIGGKHAGHGDRRDMWPEAIRAVRDLLPEGFIFENVKGLARPVFSDYLEWITANLGCPHLARGEDELFYEHLIRLRQSREERIYDVTVLNLNAADYGVPQKRHRVIIMGIRRDLDLPLLLPQKSHSRERLLWDQWVTGEYWARHGMKMPADQQIPTTDISLVRKLRQHLLPPATAPWATVRDALRGLGEPNGINNHRLQSGARIYPGHTGSALDQPAKALKAGAHGVPGGENMMVRDDGTVRYFSIREAARLQTFDDNYAFPGSWTESMRQLGNAVPVTLARVVAEAMASTLRDQKSAGLTAPTV